MQNINRGSKVGVKIRKKGEKKILYATTTEKYISISFAIYYLTT